MERKKGKRQPKQIILHVDAGRLEHLGLCAKANYRSRNDEVIWRLHKSLDGGEVDGFSSFVNQFPTGVKLVKKKKQKPLLIRIDADLLDHLGSCAKANYRSRSSEILWRIDMSVEGELIDEHGRIVKQLPVGVKQVSDN